MPSRAEGAWIVGLGECHVHLENYDLVRGCARQALELRPEGGSWLGMASAWNVLGWVHSRLGEHRQALSCYRQALALTRDRKDPEARRLAGWPADPVRRHMPGHR